MLRWFRSLIHYFDYFFSLQIVDYGSSQSHKPLKLYDTKFAAYLPSSSMDDKDGEEDEEEEEEGSSCEPTIVCFNKNDSVLEVRTDSWYCHSLLIGERLLLKSAILYSLDQTPLSISSRSRIEAIPLDVLNEIVATLKY